MSLLLILKLLYLSIYVCMYVFNMEGQTERKYQVIENKLYLYKENKLLSHRHRWNKKRISNKMSSSAWPKRDLCSCLTSRLRRRRLTCLCGCSLFSLNGASGVIFYGIQMKGVRSCERYNHANSLYPLLSEPHEKVISPTELSPWPGTKISSYLM